MALHHCQNALSLAISGGSIKGQCEALLNLAWIKRGLGDSAGAQQHACKSQRLAKISGDFSRGADSLYIEAG